MPIPTNGNHARESQVGDDREALIATRTGRVASQRPDKTEHRLNHLVSGEQLVVVVIGQR